jgi:hypothetical protein
MVFEKDTDDQGPEPRFRRMDDGGNGLHVSSGHDDLGSMRGSTVQVCKYES